VSLANSKPRSVHWWTSAAFIMLGVLAAITITVQSFRSQDLVEHRIFRELLTSIASSYAEQQTLRPDMPLPHAGILRSWFVEDDKFPPEMPAYLASLPPGYFTSEGNHGVFKTHDRFHALITATASGRLITVIDITELEDQQNRDARLSGILGGVLIAVIALVIGWLHRNLARPIKDLAERMQSIDPHVTGERLPEVYRQQEIQIIARASNAHLARVEQFIEREKSLLDQASHEFRTPIAVISGAVNVLRQQTLPASAQPVLDRIEYTVGYLSEIMVALLYLSREARPDSDDVTAVHLLLPSVVHDHKHLLRQKPVDFRLTEFEPTYIFAPEAMVRIAVSNLIRNAIENTHEGHVEVTLISGVICVSDSGAGFDPAEAARRYRDTLRASAPTQGQGLGLFLIRRICDRFGWRLTMDSMPLDGTQARLDVTSSLCPDLDLL
jgi:signal transduction histidine kinase